MKIWFVTNNNKGTENLKYNQRVKVFEDYDKMYNHVKCLGWDESNIARMPPRTGMRSLMESGDINISVFCTKLIKGTDNGNNI